jgi:hypothetical protein
MADYLVDLVEQLFYLFNWKFLSCNRIFIVIQTRMPRLFFMIDFVSNGTLLLLTEPMHAVK